MQANLSISNSVAITKVKLERRALIKNYGRKRCAGLSFAPQSLIAAGKCICIEALDQGDVMTLVVLIPMTEHRYFVVPFSPSDLSQRQLGCLRDYIVSHCRENGKRAFTQFKSFWEHASIFESFINLFASNEIQSNTRYLEISNSNALKELAWVGQYKLPPEFSISELNLQATRRLCNWLVEQKKTVQFDTQFPILNSAPS